MATERFNKVGIRILDDPKQRNHATPTRCLPDEHKWRRTGETRVIQGSWYVIGDELQHEIECRLCGEKDWQDGD